MSKKENIAEVLSTIYHQKLDVYLNDSSVLHEINIKGDAVTCTFIEYPGSVEINQLKHKIEEKIFELKWVKEIEIKLRVIPTSTTKRTAGLENISQIIAV